MVLLSGTMDIQDIVMSQDRMWNIFQGHLPAVAAFIVYLIAGNAEANRGRIKLTMKDIEQV
jgi:NADH-quinone oxidoreductase subunit H